PYFGLKLEAEERRAARAGLELRYPLLDSRLVELVLAIPSSRRMARGERKGLLRAAAADVLPPEVLGRRGKGDWTTPVDRALARTRRAARGPADIAVVHGRAAAFAALRRVLAPPLAGTWFEERALPDGRRYLRWAGLFEFIVAADGRRIVSRRLAPASETPRA